MVNKIFKSSCQIWQSEAGKIHMALEISYKQGVNRSFCQGLGLAIFMGSYMFSWTFGKIVGLPSFEGIGLFLALGAMLIFWSSINSFSEKLYSFFKIFYLTAFLFMMALIAFAFGEAKDIVWISLGFIEIIIICSLSSTSGRHFCIGFLFGTFLYNVFYLLNVQDAAIEASTFGDTARISFSEDNAAYSLIAYACAFCFLSALYNYITAFGSRTFCVVCMGISAIGIILAGTRSVYGGIAMGAVYAVIIGRRQAKSLNLSNFISLVLLVLLIAGVVASGFMSERVGSLSESLGRALQTFFGGGAYIEDASAAGRVYQRSQAIDLFIANPLLGAGFKAFWVDFPLLQAFSDLGIIIGLIYLILFLVIPVYLCLKSMRSGNNVITMLNIIYIVCVPRLFLHGQPFDWVVFTYAFLPYCAIFEQHKMSKKNV